MSRFTSFIMLLLLATSILFTSASAKHRRLSKRYLQAEAAKPAEAEKPAEATPADPASPASSKPEETPKATPAAATDPDCSNISYFTNLKVEAGRQLTPNTSGICSY
jgi:hypothetical protein